MTQPTIPTLSSGEVTTIESIAVGHGAAKRLADMGFVRGAEVEMVRPGTPCIVRIGGTCVGLGRGFQDSVRLNPAEPLGRVPHVGTPYSKKMGGGFRSR